MVEPGRTCLGDRYELEELIAAGGMGQVWRGHDVLLGRPVAVKVLRSEYTGDPTFLARFRAEAQHAASLSHPNIAAVFDYGEVVTQEGRGETLAYLVMELVEGEPLSAVLRREAPLDIPATLSVLRQTGSALAEAHRVGMVHRDVKPGNILVRDDGSVKITDFGIAWSAGSVPLTRTGQVIGTAQYLSPEQAEGRHATPASDVYALGLVGYECLTGHAAFEGDNPVTIALKQVRQDPEPLPGQLPPGVRTLIMRALDKDPDARFVDGGAFVDAVEETLAGRTPPTAVVDRPAAAVPVPPQGAAAGIASGAETRVVPGLPGEPGTGLSTGSHISPPVRRHRRRSLVLVLLPLLALLAGAAIAAVVLHNLDRDGSSAPAAATKKLDSRGIVLQASAYLGRPVDEVRGELVAEGFVVQVRAVAAPDAQPGDVTDVTPTGTELPVGSTVVVAYADQPPPATVVRRSAPRTTATHERSRVPEPTVVEQRTAPPAPTTPSTTEPTETTAPTTAADEETTTSATEDGTTAPTTDGDSTQQRSRRADRSSSRSADSDTSTSTDPVGADDS